MNIATETLLEFYNALANNFGCSDYDKQLLEESINSIEDGAVITYDDYDKATIEMQDGAGPTLTQAIMFLHQTWAEAEYIEEPKPLKMTSKQLPKAGCTIFKKAGKSND